MPAAPTPITVLCVDDDPDLADLTATYLERADEGFETRTATDPVETEARLCEDAVDSIVSDYGRPDVEGLDFLESVRKTQPDLPFVLFTGQGSERIASDAIAAGVTDYMQKGRGTDQYAILAKRVRTAVERERERRRLEAEARSRTILEGSPDAIRVSVDGQIVYVNPAAVDLFGAPDRDALVGRKSLEFLHPDERAEVRENVQLVQSGALEFTAARRRALTLDGEPFEVELTARGITWEGENALLALLRNVEHLPD